MKKTILLLMVLLFAVLTAACATDPAPVAPSSDVADESASVSELLTEEATEEATEDVTEEATEDVTEEATEAVLQLPGDKYTLKSIYVSEEYDYTQENASAVFNTDGTFVMTVNLLEGFGDFNGTYTLEGADGVVSAIRCTVTGKNFSGFTGEELASFVLTAQADGTYIVTLDGIEFVGGLEDKASFAPAE